MQEVRIKVKTREEADLTVEVLEQYLKETLTPYEFITVFPDGRTVAVGLSPLHKPAPLMPSDRQYDLAALLVAARHI